MGWADFKCDICGHVEKDVDTSLAADPNDPIFDHCPKCSATAENGNWYNKTESDSYLL